jgi:hypothetical protein
VTPRLCDEAAARLAAWFPGEVTFNYRGKVAERDTQIVQILQWAGR